MKEAIHPQYHQATVHCQGCGRDFTVGSTAAEITVELCSNCHPFYTGKQKLVDTAGRVDRFRARQAKAQAKDEKPTKAEAKTEGTPAENAEPTPESRLAEMKEQMETDSQDSAPAKTEPTDTADSDSDDADK